MPYTATQAVWQIGLRVILPPILGGIGALAATAAPAFYNAVCHMPMVPLTVLP